MFCCDLFIPVMMILCGRMIWKIGWITCIPSILIPLVFFKTTNSVIGNVGGMLLTIQTILIIGAIFPTERALKKTFTKEGVRRKKK